MASSQTQKEGRKEESREGVKVEWGRQGGREGRGKRYIPFAITLGGYTTYTRTTGTVVLDSLNSTIIMKQT